MTVINESGLYALTRHVDDEDKLTERFVLPGQKQVTGGSSFLGKSHPSLGAKRRFACKEPITYNLIRPSRRGLFRLSGISFGGT